MRTRALLLVGSAACAALAPLVSPAVAGAAGGGGGASSVGQFEALFAENAAAKDPTTACKANQPDPHGSGRLETLCTPAAASVMVLPNGKILYWDALEGMEDVHYNVVAEYGQAAQNDQSRLMDLATQTWTVPTQYDGGANPGGADGQAEYLPGVPHDNSNTSNDGDLFCSDQVFLYNGKVLDAGGTFYYQEPAGVQDPTHPGSSLGVVELEGLKNSRVYDPATNSFTQSGSMKYGRWYPGLVTLPDGKVFVASGVTKLIKPVYPTHPTDSGTNVEETETYDPATGKWSVNGTGTQQLLGDPAARSLPLFPRLHLLPDGKVYYDGAGQTFNPFGQSYDEALWNQTASYDPKTQTWATSPGPTAGVPVSKATGALPNSAATPTGFRGSGFSQMLPLVPDAAGNYPTASFLNAGGVLGVSPGTYLATDSSTINTVDTTKNDAMTSEATGSLNTPRWYGSGVTLPTGQVVVTSGADRDEVVLPGSETPVKTMEVFDPDTKTWTTGPSEDHGRTYHNTAVLLPDGSVLVGGHAPIATGYAAPTDALATTIGTGSYRRDPSFQIYKPAYFFKGDRPQVTAAPDTVQPGDTATVTTTQSDKITRVVLVRNTAMTHLVDGDQRVVQVPFSRNADGTLAVHVPASAAVLPPGPYNLMTITGDKAADQVPSIGHQLTVGRVGDTPVVTAPAAGTTITAPAAAATAPRTDAKTVAKPVGKPVAKRAAATTAVQAAAHARSLPARATGSSRPAQSTRTLAFTGAPGGVLAVLPLVLLGSGAGVLIWRRRLHGRAAA